MVELGNGRKLIEHILWESFWKNRKYKQGRKDWKIIWA